MKKFMNDRGFTLVELIIAIGLSALFLPALVFVLSFSLGAANQGENYTRAHTIAQENMEAVYHLKERWDWDTDPVGTNENEYYQLKKVGGAWELSDKTTTPTDVNGFTATIQIYPVIRDVESFDIVESAGEGDDVYDDELSRKIVVEVTWKEKGQDTKVNLVSYVSSH